MMRTAITLVTLAVFMTTGCGGKKKNDDDTDTTTDTVVDTVEDTTEDIAEDPVPDTAPDTADDTLDDPDVMEDPVDVPTDATSDAIEDPSEDTLEDTTPEVPEDTATETTADALDDDGAAAACDPTMMLGAGLGPDYWGEGTFCDSVVACVDAGVATDVSAIFSAADCGRSFYACTTADSCGILGGGYITAEQWDALCELSLVTGVHQLYCMVYA